MAMGWRPLWEVCLGAACASWWTGGPKASTLQQLLMAMRYARATGRALVTHWRDDKLQRDERRACLGGALEGAAGWPRGGRLGAWKGRADSWGSDIEKL
eukprot:Skav202963  [mRNA]  locus=scaffold2274:360015:360311:+ [translate_table: standard]